MASGVDDQRERPSAGWAAILAVVGVVLLTVVGGYLYVRSVLRQPLDPGATVRAYVQALSQSDCAGLAELSTTNHWNDIDCPPPYARGDYGLAVSQVDVGEQTPTTVSLLADVTVKYLPDGSYFTTAVAYSLVRDGDHWLVDEGRDPRPTGDRSVRLGS